MTTQPVTQIGQHDIVRKVSDIVRKIHAFPEISIIIYSMEFVHGYVYLVLNDSSRNGFGGLCISVEDLKKLERQLKNRVKFIQK